MADVVKRAEPPAVDETPARPGKGRATPSRREAEQARRRPLVPTDRKAAQRQSRAQMAAERERARVGMQRGDERYLPVRDRGPQRRYARDVVDSRFSVGEFVIPVAVVFFLASTLFATGVQSWLFAAMYAYFAITIADGLLVARRIRRALVERYGAANVQRGLNMYVVMRSAQFRRLRAPKPQVKRRETPRLG